MLALLISIYVVSDTAQSIDMVGEDVRVEGVVRGDVSIVKGNLDVLGRVTGDVSVVSGDLHLFKNAVVEGDVSVVGGDVVLDSGAVIEEDLAIVAGKLINDGGEIRGEVTKVSSGVLNMAIKGILDNTLKVVESPSSSFGRGRRHFAYTYGVLSELLSLILGFLILVIFFLLMKGFILKMVDYMERDTLRTVLFGFLVYLLMVPVLLLLIVSVVGILLIPVYIVALVIGMLISLTAGMVYVGRRIRENISREWNEWGDFLAGFAVYAVLVLLYIFVKILPFDICCLAGMVKALYNIYLVALSVLGLGVLFKIIFRIKD